MSRLVEASGAQVLPRAADERVTVPVHAAHTAISADLRSRSGAHMELAKQLRVVR